MSTTPIRPWHALVGATMATSLMLAGCASDDADESGDAAPTDEAADTEEAEPITLRMASPYCDDALAARTGANYLLTIRHFVEQVEQLSADNITIDVVFRAADDDPEYCEVFPDGEQQVVQAVADGRVDLAWVGTRVFDTFGVGGFAALQAPFLVDSYPLQAAILDTDIPERLLTGLDDIGVVGLAVLAGGLRKPVGVETPLLGPVDWAGITFHHWPSNVQADTITTLGATPTNIDRDPGIRAGDIDGYEHSLVIYGRGSPASRMTLNVNLWPETKALIGNPEALAILTEAQAGFLQEAATDTSARSAELHDIDAGFVEGLCERGVRVAEASEADLAALRDAVQPVYDRLAEDTDTAAYIAEIERLKGSVTAEPLAIPDGCTDGSRVADGEDDPGALNGTYRVEWAVDELTALGVPGDAIDEFEMAGVFTWVLTDGELHFTGEPVGGDTYACDGTYGVTGDTINLLREAPCPAWHWAATWELTDDVLVFSDTTHEGEFEPLVEAWLAGKPWAKID